MYAKEAVEHYKRLPNELDKLINELLTLKEMDKIQENKHYHIKKDGDRIHIMFHKGTLLKIHNDNFKENHQKISKTVFNNWLRNDNRVINHNITGYYEGKRKSSVIIDISDSPDVWEFSGYPEPVNSDDLPNNNNLSEIKELFKDKEDNIT